jgi:hypothetical protein
LINNNNNNIINNLVFLKVQKTQFNNFISLF